MKITYLFIILFSLSASSLLLARDYYGEVEEYETELILSCFDRPICTAKVQLWQRPFGQSANTVKSFSMVGVQTNDRLLLTQKDESLTTVLDLEIRKSSSPLGSKYLCTVVFLGDLKWNDVNYDVFIKEEFVVLDQNECNKL
ncbi:MAG: hypothetical protein ISR65_01470 [Bacteriovoracaceae bacterium]|nr:hypothetical protein [Bacteriovoracaceae bacterium]